MSKVPRKILKRIASLLRLASNEGATEGERATAQLRADAIMDKYAIEVDLSELEPDEAPPGIERLSMFCAEAEHAWRHLLLAGLAAFYGVSHWVTRAKEADDGPYRYFLWLEGTFDNLRELRMHYAYLSSEIEHLVASAPRHSNRQAAAIGAASFCARALWAAADRYDAREARSRDEREASTTFRWAPDVPQDTRDPDANRHALVRSRTRRRVRIEPEAPDAADADAKEGFAKPSDGFSIDFDVSPMLQRRAADLARKKIGAHAVVNPPPTIYMPIGEALSLDLPTLVALASVNIEYVGELIKLSFKDLLQIPGIGMVRSGRLAVELELLRIRLRPDRQVFGD